MWSERGFQFAFSTQVGLFLFSFSLLLDFSPLPSRIPSCSPSFLTEFLVLKQAIHEFRYPSSECRASFDLEVSLWFS